MDKSNKLTEAIDLLGGRPAFCAALDISPQRLWNWIKREQTLPAEYCPTVERLTEGKIRCEDFWPDTDWEYMRQVNRPPKSRARRKQVAAHITTKK